MDVAGGARMDDIRALFLEYARSLDFNLCFQSFDKELAELPGPYAPPDGRLILCEVDREPAACIALKPLEAGICEMKRLYVRPAFRGQRLGHKLVSRLIDEARRAGYRSMRLDTISGTMHHAIALYRSFGFKEIPPYYKNPIPDALYMELVL
jgi:ribosomal protein S18 acetylase RimI-like enzyme